MMKFYMRIRGHRARVTFDAEVQMYRGEFTDLQGGADFYAVDLDDLRRKGEVSLQVYLDACQEEGLTP